MSQPERRERHVRLEGRFKRCRSPGKQISDLDILIRFAALVMPWHTPFLPPCRAGAAWGVPRPRGRAAEQPQPQLGHAAGAGLAPKLAAHAAGSTTCPALQQEPEVPRHGTRSHPIPTVSPGGRWLRQPGKSPHGGLGEPQKLFLLFRLARRCRASMQTNPSSRGSA